MVARMAILGSIAFAAVASASWASAPKGAPKPTRVPGQRFEIAVKDDGFEPNLVEVIKNQPVDLVFVRKTEKACFKEVILDTGVANIRLPLSAAEPAVIKTRFASSARFQCACHQTTFFGTVRAH